MEEARDVTAANEPPDNMVLDAAGVGVLPLAGELPASLTIAEVGALEATQQPTLSKSTAARLVGGTSMLGLSMLIERGTGFVGNVLAARFGGAQTFGAYSLGISTANQISTYAAGQIGSTAARFSGKYPHGSDGYATLARALTIVSAISAILASAALWLGAVPLAHLMGKAALAGLLRWAAFSAAGIVLLECARGFFVGQRRLAALLLLSLLVGGGLVVLLPLAARTHSPVRMIVIQGLITTLAVVICLLMAKPLHLHARQSAAARRMPLRPVLLEIWKFGMVQLAGLVASNLAGWWLITLVARADTTLVQMSYLSIASQLRNLVGVAPGLLTEGSYAVMADPEGEASNTPQRVMAVCSFGASAVSVLLAAIGIIVVPWALTHMYGKSFAPAAMTVSIGLAVAVVHMGNAPAAARLTIVSIKSTGVINTIWAVFVALAAMLFLFHGGKASGALIIYFCAHALSAALVLCVLRKKDGLPGGMVMLFLLSMSSVVLLAMLAWLRVKSPERSLPITGVMCAVLAAITLALGFFGNRYRWLPRMSLLRDQLASVRAKLSRR